MKKNKWKIGITGMALAAMTLAMPATVLGDSADSAVEGATNPGTNPSDSNSSSAQSTSGSGSSGVQNTSDSGASGAQNASDPGASGTQNASDSQASSGTQESSQAAEGQGISGGQAAEGTKENASGGTGNTEDAGKSSAADGEKNDGENGGDTGTKDGENTGTKDGENAGETDKKDGENAEDAEKKEGEDGEKKDAEDQPDNTADVETKADWELTLPTDLAHKEKALLKEEVTEADYRSDIVKVAWSQVGYQESEKNYVLNADDEKEFYTRYNAWYGNSYDDAWDTEFVCFVLHYAGVSVPSYDSDTEDWLEDLAEERSYSAPDLETETGEMIFTAAEPFQKNYNGKGLLDKGTASWIERLAEDKKYYHPDYRAKAGDVVFFYEEDKEDADKGTVRAGIVGGYVKEKVPNTEDQYIEKMTVIAATVGETRDSVKATRILPDDERIIGYGVVAPETVKKQKLEATVYADSGKKLLLDNVRIWLEGELPAGAEVVAYPAVVELEEETTFAVYDVHVIGVRGNEYHSSAKDGRSYTLSIENEALVKALEKAKDVRCWYMDDDSAAETTDLGYKISEKGMISLQTEEF